MSVYHGITQSTNKMHQHYIQYVVGGMLFAIYLFTPQRAVVCTLSKQEVLQQPEEPNQTGTERQNHSLGIPQVRQRRLQHHLQQTGTQSGKKGDKAEGVA